MQTVTARRTQPQWVTQGGAAPAFWLPSLCLSPPLHPPHRRPAQYRQDLQVINRGLGVTESTALSLSLPCEMGPHAPCSFRQRMKCASLLHFLFCMCASPSVICALVNLNFSVHWRGVGFLHYCKTCKRMTKWGLHIWLRVPGEGMAKTSIHTGYGSRWRTPSIPGLRRQRQMGLWMSRPTWSTYWVLGQSKPYIVILFLKKKNTKTKTNKQETSVSELTVDPAKVWHIFSSFVC